jgi:hypothetical protein
MPTGEGFNRALWVFRGLIALIAIALVALIVHRAAGHPTDSDWLDLTAGNGRTAQGDTIAMRFHRDRRGLRVVEVSDRSNADGTFGQSVFSMRATLGPGARQVRGWVRLTATFSGADGWGTRCDSGRVRFAIDAPLAPTPATSARPS